MTPAPKPRAETALGSGPSRFVRALWGLDVRVQLLPPAPADSELVPRRPRFTGSTLWLPASPLAGTPGGFADYLFAASAHISAHLRFGGPRFEPKSLKPIQIAVISLVEDARVERLAAAHYPGLARLWAPYHQARAHGAKTSLSLLSRLARALHDDQYVDDDSWVSKGRQLFLAGRAEWSDESLSRRIGGALGNDLGQMRVQFNPKDYVVEPAYRDDHIGLWHFAQEPADDGTALELESRRRVEGEQARSKQHERAEPEPHRPSDEHPRERTSTLQLEAPAQAASPLRYGEWDYLIQRDRPAFCSVFERPVLPDDRTALASALPSAAYARKRLERAALRLAEQHPQRERRLLDGDRLDLPAVIATVALDRSAAQPAPRVYQRVFFRREPPALLLLLDLSESLNARPQPTCTTLLELAQRSAALLAESLGSLGTDLAIHGFSSNGRHDIGYRRFKDFDDPYDERARARLAGMRAELSTRLGAALRHAGRALLTRKARRKLLLVVTDGEPSDIDVHDPKYLLFDAKQATIQNRRAGVTSYCLGLDPKAENSVSRIFGVRNYSLVDRLETLPQRLTDLSLRLSVRAAGARDHCQ